ncbi:glutaredoxin [Acidaminobacter sp. JC074]|uniref:protein disulfide oxidoreductase n=1 Tax=Acidaminobacter sp. JC074 TaxID=2530199 RepID=UPI001F107C28|nr:thioredoxin family protein [Acidaminobacter sp. JC074]MCH4887666.1 glutaredoxin [Acidaminobacter sp. JC074]
MSLFNEDVKKQLTDIFEGLNKPVNMVLFTDEADCDTCKETTEFMKEMESLSDKIGLELYDVKKDTEKAKLYKVDKAPGIVLLDEERNDFGMVFSGIPAGHEINSFISGLMEVSGSGETLPQEVVDQLNTLDKPVKIKVFVTLACPHCSGAVSKAHKLAYENENIEAEMIECSTFPELASQYNVQGVPKIVFNETEELIGNQPFDQFVDAVMKA